MAARGTLFGEGPTACPFVALELDRDRRSDRPDYRHRCYAEPTPAPRTIAHQEAYCLSPKFPTCPIFQDWAVRATARPVPLPQGYEGRHTEPAEVAPIVASAAAVAAVAGDAGSADEPEPVDAPAPREPEWPDSMASSVSIGAATAASLADAGGGPDEQLGAFDSPAPAVEPMAAEPLAAEPMAADPQDAYESWPDEPPPGETAGDLAGDPHAAPAPAFLAARSGRPRPSPTLDDGVKRDDVVPSWEIDGRYGAQSGGPPSTGGGFGRLFTMIAVILILALGVLAVFTLPGLLAGNPSQTARPQTSGLATNLPTPLSSSVAVVPTPTVVPPSITPPTVVPTEATPTPEPSPQTYKIKPGDTLARIARKFDTTVEAIMAANPQIDNPNHIEVGQVIVIPTPPPT
jgi:LysM repeat protein